MASLEVSADIEIAASPADIAGVMFDAAREPEWMSTVTGVELIDPSLEPGARQRRTGSVMGKTFSWTSVVEAIHFPHVLILRTDDGPFVGAVRFDIQRSGGGSRVRVRTAGELKDLGFVPAAVVAGPMQSALLADLARLKAIVEG